MQLTNSTDTAVRLERQMLHDSDSAIMYFPPVHAERSTGLASP